MSGDITADDCDTESANGLAEQGIAHVGNAVSVNAVENAEKMLQAKREVLMAAQQRRRIAQRAVEAAAASVRELIAHEQQLELEVEQALKEAKLAGVVVDIMGRDSDASRDSKKTQDNVIETAEAIEDPNGDQSVEQDARERYEARKAEIDACLMAQRDAVENGLAPKRSHRVGFLAADDPRTKPSQRVALASYPRSGNSLMRSIVERITKIYTGSDCDPLRPLNKQLVQAGMMGEGFVKDLVFAVKTHFPERLGRCGMTAGRAVLIVRNPFDAIVSYFNMVLTQTHTHTIEDDEFIKYADIWDTFVREEISVWKQFHAHWLSEQIKLNVPILLVRYEDIIYHREASMRKIAEFLYQAEGLDADDLEEIIRETCGAAAEGLGVYAPRDHKSKEKDSFRTAPMDVDNDEGDSDDKTKTSSTDGAQDSPSNPETHSHEHLPLPPEALRNLKFFSDQQQAYIFTVAKSELVHFGYWDSFFQATQGEGHEDRPLDACIVVKQATKKRPGFGNRNHYLVLNQRFALRPLTEDDPFGRGFGKRWQAALDKLPPVRIKTKGGNPK
mmetsp:Transcript_7759/g.15398  ORF Transcript_7759/g.15398 Transcript_7759/m.15398 type:complete len:558 (+) Transcript_7759:85-1758(+)